MRMGGARVQSVVTLKGVATIQICFLLLLVVASWGCSTSPS